MLDTLKDKCVGDLRRQIADLRLDIKEREDWLREDHEVEAVRPVFSRRYNSKSLELLRARDNRCDHKLDTVEERQELSPEAKKAIRALRSKLNRELALELAKLSDDLELQFKENELFSNLTEEEKQGVMKDHERSCASLENRMRSSTQREIERVHNSPGSIVRTAQGTQYEKLRSEARRERRDKEEISFYIQLMKKEKELLSEFDEYVLSLSPEDRMCDEDLVLCRTKHEEEVTTILNDEKQAFLAEQARKDRMSRARRINVQPRQHKKLLLVYVDEMNASYVQDSPSVEWKRMLVDIDRVFAQCGGDWHQFIKISVYYWSCLAQPQKRAKFDRIISRYASLMMEPEHNLVQLPYTKEVESLRRSRDELVSQVLKLDEVTRARTSKMKKTSRIRPVHKITPPIVRDYSTKESIEPVRKISSMQWDD